jgi:hypothetical protein
VGVLGLGAPMPRTLYAASMQLNAPEGGGHLYSSIFESGAQFARPIFGKTLSRKLWDGHNIGG